MGPVFLYRLGRVLTGFAAPRHLGVSTVSGTTTLPLRLRESFDGLGRSTVPFAIGSNGPDGRSISLAYGAPLGEMLTREGQQWAFERTGSRTPEQSRRLERR